MVAELGDTVTLEGGWQGGELLEGEGSPGRASSTVISARVNRKWGPDRLHCVNSYWKKIHRDSIVLLLASYVDTHIQEENSIPSGKKGPIILFWTVLGHFWC